jgi:hypothetical protein
MLVLALCAGRHAAILCNGYSIPSLTTGKVILFCAEPLTMRQKVLFIKSIETVVRVLVSIGQIILVLRVIFPTLYFCLLIVLQNAHVRFLSAL